MFNQGVFILHEYLETFAKKST